MILAFMPARACRLVLTLVLLLCAGAAAPARDSEEAREAGSDAAGEEIGAGGVEGDAREALVDTLRLEGMRFVASNGPANDAIVEADRARFVRSARVAHMSGVRARVGKAAGSGATSRGGVELECERARFDLASGDLTAEGNVRGVTEDGRRFETQRLIYQRATGRVSTRSPVVIRDGFGTARGSGFEYFVRQNRFRLIGGASVERGS